MSLRLKIIIIFVLCILLTFSPLLYMMQTQVKEKHMAQLDDEITQLLDSKSHEVGSWLEKRKSEIKVLLGLDLANNLDKKEVYSFIEKLNQSDDFKYRFALGATDGIGFVGENWYIDISKRDYFHKLMTSNVDYVISEPVISRSDGRPIFLLSYAIKNAKDEKIGFINGAIPLDSISEIVNNIEIYDGFSWIMNTDLEPYSVNKNKLTSNYIQEDDLNLIKKAFSQRRQGSLSLENVNGQKTKVYYSYIPHSPNWILCSMIKEDSMNQQIDSIINIILSIGFIFILISIITSIFISGSIVEPIQELKYNMSEVSKGKLDSYYQVKGKDEISSLGQYFNTMLDDIKSLLDKTYKMEEQKRKMEIEVLQSQIKPHFLYNTLDTIQWKALEKDNYEVADLINNLSEFFRLSLNDGREFISLEEEISQSIAYLHIQKTRYEDKLDYCLNYDKNLNNIYLPKLLIQPLIENSIYHGIKPMDRKGLITIDIYSQADNIIMVIEDNGRGMDKENLDKLKLNLDKSISTDNYGLYNVNERLKNHYDNRYSIQIDSKLNYGTKISIKIPMEASKNV